MATQGDRAEEEREEEKDRQDLRMIDAICCLNMGSAGLCLIIMNGGHVFFLHK